MSAPDTSARVITKHDRMTRRYVRVSMFFTALAIAVVFHATFLLH